MVAGERGKRARGRVWVLGSVELSPRAEFRGVDVVLITPVCLPRVSWGKSDVDAQSGNTPVSMCGNFLDIIRCQA